MNLPEHSKSLLPDRVTAMHVICREEWRRLGAGGEQDEGMCVLGGVREAVLQVRSCLRVRKKTLVHDDETHSPFAWDSSLYHVQTI